MSLKFPVTFRNRLATLSALAEDFMVQVLRRFIVKIGLTLTAVLAVLSWNTGAFAQAVPQKTADGVIVPIQNGFLNVSVRSETVIRVAFAADQKFFSHPSIMAVPKTGPAAKWDLATADGKATISTAKLKAVIDLTTGAVSFQDASGKPILAELPDGRKVQPADVMGEKTNNIRQQWASDPTESLYGMGQQQLGLMDIKNYDLEYWQHNGTVVIPFLVSSKGYGILWDNNSYTRLGDLRQFEPIPAEYLYDTSGKSGGLTMGTFTPPDGATMNPAQSAAITYTPAAGRGGGGGGGRGRRGAAAATAPAAGAATQPAPAARRGARGGGGGGRGGGGPQNTRWEGQVQAPVTGDYQFQAYSNGGIKVWIDGKVVMDHWRQNWLPWYDLARVHLEAGKQYPIKIEWTIEDGSTMNFTWKTPTSPQDSADKVALENKGTSLWSEAADGIDYYFCYGPDLDHVVSGYREVTGQANMLPQWAFGLWQSRDHFINQEQSVDVVNQYRQKQIPLDNIVQDWQYWPGASLQTVGSWAFDPARFPDPSAMVKQVHDLHAHMMITVWGWIDQQSEDTRNAQTSSANYLEMLKNNYLLATTYGPQARTFVDMFNPDARKLFWQEMSKELFVHNFDAWWLDAAEPDLVTAAPTLEAFRQFMTPNHLGTGADNLNAYPILESSAVYGGQRSEKPDQRVFILTRSGFAGQQRYSGSVWSGDSTVTWTAMKKQITAGLGYSLSGMPYWSMDIGGYDLPQRFSRNRTPEADDEWDELQTRWFEFGTFVPITRIHGQAPNQATYREIYNHKEPAVTAMVRYDKLRYALMPYIYSLAGDVTQNSGTIMRPLVMDFQNDATAREIGDQYMFGPAFLVNPVSDYKARSRQVYLPPSGGWYEFWTGASASAGQSVDSPAPLDSIPLYVKAGSIIPTGPVMQYVAEKPESSITVYVYTGADGKFTLYEDQGLNYNYEKGEFAQIPMMWNDSTKTLSIGKRTGSFPGMLDQRDFNVIFVSKDHPVGFAFDAKADKSVNYTGEAVDVKE
jgi:alpha-D-xyloside xylohydrolase